LPLDSLVNGIRYLLAFHLHFSTFKL